MGMAIGHWRRTREVNNSYRARHKRTKKNRVPTGQDGTPRGKHIRTAPGKPSICACGGCSAKNG